MISEKSACDPMERRRNGFTLVEMVVVLLLISIIAAAVFTRSISTGQINFVGQVEKIRSQIRYAQSMAMKRNEIWGFKSDGLSPSTYWMFTGTNADRISNRRAFPGEEANQVSLAPFEVSMEASVYFDPFGKPYSPDAATPVANQLSIPVSGPGGQMRSIVIYGETGLVK